MFESPPFWMYAVGFLLLLGPLVTVHELGHYLVARWFGVGAEAFSIGFGKEIAGFTDKRGTRWKLSMLPLGGYVQFRGDMNPASIPDPNSPERSTLEDGSFQNAVLWKRALIVAAGPVTNLIVAIAIFFAFNYAYGKPVAPDPEEMGVVASFTDDSRAKAAGMQVGDRIVAVDGVEMASWRETQNAIFPYPNRELVIAIVRDGERMDIPVTAGSREVEDGFGNKSTIGLIGVQVESVEERFEPLTLTQSAGRAVGQCVDMVRLITVGIGQIISGDRSIKELGGPIKIAKYSGERLSLGMTEFIFFSALISLNLAFINFLPIPALDGGHLAFYAYEAIRGRPPGPMATEWAYRVGLLLILSFMAFVIMNDVISLPFFGG